VRSLILEGVRHGVGDDVRDVRVSEGVFRFAPVPGHRDKPGGAEGSQVL
jgi:hypothetical protein